MTRAYWDSCVFIDLLQKTAGRYPACDEWFERAQKGEVEIVMEAEQGEAR